MSDLQQLIDSLRDTTAMRAHARVDGEDRDITDELLTKSHGLDQRDGGVLEMPAGNFFLSDDWVAPTRPFIFDGSGFEATILHFAPGKGLKAWAPRTTFRNLTINCSRQRYLELRVKNDAGQNIVYAPGDRRRSPLAELAKGHINDVDLGVHLVCMTGGTLDDTITLTTNRPGDTMQLGQTVWMVEAWPGIDIKGSYCLFENVGVNFAEDSGFYVHGTIVAGSSDGIADSNVFINCRVTSVDGHAYYVAGDDGNRNIFINCWGEEISRGVVGYDCGFLANKWQSCGAVTARRSFQAPHKPWASNFDSCYAENNCQDGMLIEAPNTASFYAGGYSKDPRLTGRRDNGVVFEGGLNARGLDGVQIEFGGPQGLVAVQVPGDVGMIARKLMKRSDDPVGVLRESYNLSAAALTVDLLMPRSRIAPGKLRFPQGFLFGEEQPGQHQVRKFPLPHRPGPDDIARTSTRVYRVGDFCWNSGPGSPVGWKANQNAAWGGGLQYASRFYRKYDDVTFRARLQLGECIEPSDPSVARAYLAERLELRMPDGTWVEDVERATFVIGLDPQSVEPDWSQATTVGASLYEIVSAVALNDRRVKWTCYSAVLEPEDVWEAM